MNFRAKKRLQLLNRIHRRYETRTETLRVVSGNYHISLPFLRIANPDRVLDQVAAEVDRLDKITGNRRASDLLNLPYWAELWDSALGMAQLLIRRLGESRLSGLDGRDAPPEVIHEAANGRSVLDLGCGMGFVGAVAAHLGADVLFADLEPPALLFAQFNGLGVTSRTAARRIDWQTTNLRRQFNLILGCDVIYERSQWAALERFWRSHLAGGGRVLLGEPGRQTGEGFLNWISSDFWSVAVFSEQVTTRSQPIRIFELQRR